MEWFHSNFRLLLQWCPWFLTISVIICPTRKNSFLLQGWKIVVILASSVTTENSWWLKSHAVIYAKMPVVKNLCCYIWWFPPPISPIHSQKTRKFSPFPLMIVDFTLFPQYFCMLFWLSSYYMCKFSLIFIYKILNNCCIFVSNNIYFN